MTAERIDRDRVASGPPSDLLSLLNGACVSAGYLPGARLLRHFANAVFLLEHAPVVARVGYGPAAKAKAATAIAVTRWLEEQGFPVTTPANLPNGREQPLTINHNGRDVAITFWRYYPQPPDLPWPDTVALGQIASALHQLPRPPVPLNTYRPLRSLHAAITNPAAEQALPSADLTWLLRRVEELRARFDDLDFPLGRGLIHADTYAGNLLWNPGDSRNPVVLGDWDSVCIGQREIDLIPTYHEPRFGVPHSTVQDFADAYGYDLTAWPGFGVLYDIRELSTLSALVRLTPRHPGSAAELAHRIRTLRDGDRTALWHGQ